MFNVSYQLTRYHTRHYKKIRLPMCSIPMTSCIMPPIKLSSMAYDASLSIGELPNSAVNSDMMAVGPRVISLDVPKNK